MHCCWLSFYLRVRSEFGNLSRGLLNFDTARILYLSRIRGESILLLDLLIDPVERPHIFILYYYLVRHFKVVIRHVLNIIHVLLLLMLLLLLLHLLLMVLRLGMGSSCCCCCCAFESCHTALVVQLWLQVVFSVASICLIRIGSTS